MFWRKTNKIPLENLSLRICLAGPSWPAPVSPLPPDDKEIKRRPCMVKIIFNKTRNQEKGLFPDLYKSFYGLSRIKMQPISGIRSVQYFRKFLLLENMDTRVAINATLKAWTSIQIIYRVDFFTGTPPKSSFSLNTQAVTI